jgi:hypothetical protein
MIQLPNEGPWLSENERDIKIKYDKLVRDFPCMKRWFPFGEKSPKEDPYMGTNCADWEYERIKIVLADVNPGKLPDDMEIPPTTGKLTPNTIEYLRQC